MARENYRIKRLVLGGGSTVSVPVVPDVPTGDGTMDFSLAAGDNTGLLALLEDI
jgi:hypothetical protein